MKVLVDLQGVQTQSRRRGIGRYTRELTRAFIAAAGRHEVHVALNAALDADGSDAAIADLLPLLPRDRIHYLRLPDDIAEQFPLTGAWRRAAAARLMRHACEAVRPDATWHTSVFEGMNEDAVVPDIPSSHHASVATLYDLIPLHDRALHLPTGAAHDWYARRLDFLRGCDRLFAISEWTKRDAVERLDLAPERIVVVGGAVDPRFQPGADATAVRAAHGIVRPFVLYNGGLDPRKNVDLLLDAFARLPPALRARHQLVLVGRGELEQAALARRAAQLGIRDDVVLPGFVPDDDLVALYGACALFVFPSRFEGFGLPPLEAMACGAPVLCSRATSLPEVVGHDDALFDPDDVDGLRDRMAAVLADPAHAQALRARGLRRATDMTWNAVAARAWDGFEALHGRAAAERTAQVAARDVDAVDAAREAALLADLAALPGTPAPDDLARAAVGIVATRVPEEPRWLVDVSAVARHDLGTGIQQVVRNVLREWLADPPAGVRIAPVRIDGGHIRHARAFARTLADGAGDGDDGFVLARPGDVFVGLDWSFDQLPAVRDRLADWRRGGMRSCFVVYDLLPLASPQYFHPNATAHYTRWLQDAVHLADRFACISRATADALSHWLAEHAARDQFGRRVAVEAFPLGAPPVTHTDAGALRPTLHAALAARPTFLMVGTLEPRKGHADGLDACEALWQSGVDANLVVAGRRGWMTDALVARLRRHPERDRRLFWHEDVADPELQALYAGSTALLALSHGEGYGLPLVEAARHGMPVFARDLPVFREVLGDYPELLAGAPSDWSATLARWLASCPTRKSPPPLPDWRDSARALAAIVRGTQRD